MRIGSPYRTAFFGGGVTTNLVPGLFMAAIDGVPVMLETGGESAMFPDGTWRHETSPLLRDQSNDGVTGVKTLNPEAGWRRAVVSWHKGAGQVHLDHDHSDPSRFNESKGIDVWTESEITLQREAVQSDASANTNLKLLPVRTRLYTIDGTVLAYTTGGAPTTITGAAGIWRDLTTDGGQVYACDGADIFQFAWDGAALGAAWSATPADILEWVNGRLMAADNAASPSTIMSFDAAGVATLVPVAAVLPDDWTWTGFAAGNSAIYASGHADQRSEIFRIGIREDGTGLDAAIPAGELPDGEIARSIGSYLGFIVIGTDAGVRFATADGAGNLTIGALLRTDAACYAFEGQDQFVWFGWDNFDATDTGLGRLSLEEFASVENLAPAFASDLMAAGVQGSVTSVVTFAGKRHFAVSGVGFYAEGTDLVPEGFVTSGEIDYELTESKIALEVVVRHDTVLGSHTVGLRAVPDTTFGTLGTHSTSEEPFPANALEGRAFELKITLNRDEGSPSVGPKIITASLRIQPIAAGARLIFVPVILHETVSARGGVRKRQDTDEMFTAFTKLVNERPVITYQEGNVSYSVQVDDREYRVWQIADSGAREGTCLMALREV